MSPLSTLDLRDELQHIHAGAFAWAVRCCRGDRDEAEDVLHVAYGKVLDGRARFDGQSTFRTWLFGVIRMTAREERRWHWLQLTRLEHWWQASRGDDPSASNSPHDDDGVAAITLALRRLSRRQQEILHLVFYESLSIQDAANVLEMQIGTARTHYERGKARLRQLLDAEDFR